MDEPPSQGDEAETSKGESDDVGFKKRRKRGRENLKAKTLDEPVVKPQEVSQNVQPADSDQAQPEKADEDDGEDRPEAATAADKNGSSEDEECEQEEGTEASAVVRKQRKKKESPFVTTTKQKIRDLQAHSWASDRSAMPDKSMRSDQYAVEVESIVRDPTRPKWEGPQKQSSARAISRFDYQPDLCKDWNETGYCGYGDSCKFMHDRGDYKSGWQLEREFEEEQKRKRMMAMGEAVDAEEDYRINPEDEDLPWACLLCREDFVNPVVTQCRHYFCEKCALGYYASGKTRCPTCNVQTHGIFNTAHRLLANLERLKTKREEEAKRAEDVTKAKKRETSWAL